MQNIRSAHFKICLCITVLIAALWTFQSWWRWSHFSYTTFDLAFYVQALDGFTHGRNWSSLLGVKPFGNHADFIILLIWPLFAVIRHPMTLIVVQNLALAACLPLGWKIARQMGWNSRSSFWLASVLLINPVLTFVALHEFHPEAFAAPLWLAIYHSWQKKNLRAFWLFLILFLSCKENLGLLAGAWCFIKLFEHPSRQILWQWIIFPGLFIAGWMAVYLFWLGPKWNAGNVDFGALYSHLHEKGLLAGASDVFHSSLQGSILWALLLPMLFLPLRKPLSLLPTMPLLLQHLLSWRSSEWTIYFHYAAPILPVFWIATLESLNPQNGEGKKWYATMPFFLVLANLVCFFIVETPEKFLAPFSNIDSQLAAKKAIVREIPAEASVLAPLPFQSQLAERPEIYSLHLVLKGLKTLSRNIYSPPPPTDFVIVDYDDTITFDSNSGYYHPAMKLRTGEVVSSSDALLHQFLSKASWQVDSVGALTVFQKISAQPVVATPTSIPLKSGLIDSATDLMTLSVMNNNGQIQVTSEWSYRSERRKIPWLHVIATQIGTGEQRIFNRGLCCPEGRADGGIWRDTWNLPAELLIRPEEWSFRAIFEDHATRSYTHRELNGDEIFAIDIPWKK
ncbi:MAG: DUF2079 domain-containing protein [Chthoniobacterales bacterium]